MARNRSGFYSTIEYIGPRPQKPKRPNFFGGWVILVIAGGIAFLFGKPLVESLKAAQNGISLEQSNLMITNLSGSEKPGDRLAAAALSHSRDSVAFDSAYYKIDFPGGDVPLTKGNAEDVVIRCFRSLGVDLQKEVNDDITANFRLYPQLWDAAAPDPNIDHRRAQNLARFFSRHGETLANTRKPADYLPGDVVVWVLANGKAHIGIVVPPADGNDGEPWIVHNNGAGVKWESGLFDYQIIGHYRYSPHSKDATATAAAAKNDSF